MSVSTANIIEPLTMAIRHLMNSHAANNKQGLKKNYTKGKQIFIKQNIKFIMKNFNVRMMTQSLCLLHTLLSSLPPPPPPPYRHCWMRDSQGPEAQALGQTQRRDVCEPYTQL